MNPGANHLGLGRLLRSDKVLSALKEGIEEVKNSFPTIVWTYTDPIRKQIFNYKKAIDSIKNWNTPVHSCCCHSSSPYWNSDVGHILTEDLSFVENNLLRKLLILGPKFREPAVVNFDSLKNSILESVDDLISTWAKKEKQETECWDQWKAALGDTLEARVQKLKKSKSKAHATPSLRDVVVQVALRLLHEHFVLIPADKAECNVIIVCKKFYLERVVKELGDDVNGTYREVFNKKGIIDTCVNEIKEKFSIDVPEVHKALVSFYWTAKMHKKRAAMRFIAASHKRFTKGLSKKLTFFLKKVLNTLRQVCNNLKRDTGADHCLVIDNSIPVIKRIDQINGRHDMDTVDTFDFKDLYTKIPHEELKNQLALVIALAFKHARGKKPNKECFLMCATKNLGAVFVEKKSKNAVTEQKLVEMVNYLIDHVFIEVGPKFFQQVVGIPMGTDCGPLLANLYQFSREYDWLLKKWGREGKEDDAWKADRDLVRSFAHTFRYIDDLITFNNRGTLEGIWKEMYPFLTLEKTNVETNTCVFLDLQLNIKNGGMRKQPYDKRDDFKFDIVSFPNLASNISFRNSHGIFISQLIRLMRNCDFYADFCQKSKVLFEKLLRQGFSKRLLRRGIAKFYEKYKNLLGKYTLSSSLGLVRDITNGLK